MAIKIEVMKRSFTFNGVNLPDPGVEYSPADVQELHSAQFPDISTALIEGPVHSDKSGTLEYKFVRNVGTKG